MQRLDLDTVNRIRSATFPGSFGWRGYDRVEVETFLETLADWLEARIESPDNDTTPEGSVRSEQPTLDSAEAAVLDSEVIAELESRIGQLEREASNARRRESRLIALLEDAREKLHTAENGSEAEAEAPPPPRRRAARGKPQATLPKGKIDINEVTFEQLRALGLSITGSAHLIALREIRDGFDSLSVLDEIEGISTESRAKLKKRLTSPPREP